ncbi:ABC transporter G family member 20 [Orchesella cincta]|uniref:ABC transporter G family member 20 n=1 Tax=Orchesella cincta TaxID=48709 RepID=A0A1D2MNK9_ORCCI|nr:ABC transporter G family member 20 [Orchesella cincta]
MSDSIKKGMENPTFEDDTQYVPPGILPVSPSKLQGWDPDFVQIGMSETTGPSQRNAVVVRSAYKQYKTRQGTNVVLHNFNMTVQEGTIYSLLGSSGCGKTTILSCCVGVKSLDSGHILINGAEPGTRASGVPGRHVGYMPQDIALYNEFSIGEVLQYYGRMYGMSSSTVAKNMDFLIGFLALPKPDRRIGSLSGGQKRRVSLSVALIHRPKLLILDEPIGLMRGGRLLAEDSPDLLLKKHNATLLEDIVLKLCLQDNCDEDNESSSDSTTTDGSSVPTITMPLPSKKSRWKKISEKERHSAMNAFNLSPEKDGSTCSSASNINDENVSPTGLVINNNSTDKIDPSCPDQVVGLTYTTLESGAEGKGDPLQACFDRGYLSDCSDSNDSSASAAVRRAALTNGGFYHEENSMKTNLKNNVKESFNRIYAMSHKNIVILLRNILLLLFMVFVPASQIVVICLAIGQDPKGLHFGVVNKDISDSLNNCVVPTTCITTDNFTGSVSCLFLDYLKKHEILDLRIYESEADAIESVKQTKDWGYMVFPENYTIHMRERAIFGIHAEASVIYGSRIKFRLDQSNLQIYRENAKLFFKTFHEFTKNVSEVCGVDPVQTDLPLYFDTPIYGDESINFTDFLAPSVLLAILFFFPLCGSSIAYISEKRAGNLARILVAGVQTWEVMLAYLLVHVVVLIFQTALSFIIMVSVFNIQIIGPVLWAVALALLVGISGMSMGFVLATFCQEEIQAVLLAMGTFFPNFLLAGMVWPTQGMPLYLQYISYFLPCTLACEAMRSIVSRGVDITHPVVWPGFASTFAWIILYWTLTVIIHRVSSKK